MSAIYKFLTKICFNYSFHFFVNRKIQGHFVNHIVLCHFACNKQKKNTFETQEKKNYFPIPSISSLNFKHLVTKGSCKIYLS